MYRARLARRLVAQMHYERAAAEQARKKAEEEKLARETRALAEAATSHEPVPEPAAANECVTAYTSTCTTRAGTSSSYTHTCVM